MGACGNRDHAATARSEASTMREGFLRNAMMQGLSTTSVQRATTQSYPPQHQSPQQMDLLLKKMVVQITWATSADEVATEIQKLLNFIAHKQVPLTRMLLGKIRGSLSADTKVWAHPAVQQNLANLEQVSSAMEGVRKVSGTDSPKPKPAPKPVESDATRLATARMARQRATQAAEGSMVSALRLQNEILGFEKSLAGMRVKLNEYRSKHADAKRLEGLYHGEEKRLMQMLHSQQQPMTTQAAPPQQHHSLGQVARAAAQLKDTELTLIKGQIKHQRSKLNNNCICQYCGMELANAGGCKSHERWCLERPDQNGALKRRRPSERSGKEENPTKRTAVGGSSHTPGQPPRAPGMHLSPDNPPGATPPGSASTGTAGSTKKPHPYSPRGIFLAAVTALGSIRADMGGGRTDAEPGEGGSTAECEAEGTET